MKFYMSALSALIGVMGLSACGNSGGNSGAAPAASAVGSSAVAAASGSASAGDKPGKGVKVQPIQSPLAEETFQTLVISNALKDLGYDVQPVKQADYVPAYVAVAQGDATYLAVDWEPLQKEMYDKAGGDAKLYRQGNFIKGAAQGYLIDKKTADQYHITNIEQLKDPKLAKLFDIDGSGKGSLIGCEAGWSCEKIVEEHIKAYGLKDTIVQKQGQYNAMMADVMARYQAGKPILYYTWTPYWVSAKLVPGKDVVWLEVPFTAGVAGQETKLPNGKNYGYVVNDEFIVANKEFAQKNPAAAKLFAVAQMSLEDVSAENLLIANGENKPDQIQQHADNWIKTHGDVYNSWLSQARAAK